jgi:hypothetical protein
MDQINTTIMEKKLFVIDGYRIWAYTYEEALEHYKMIIRF